MCFDITFLDMLVRFRRHYAVQLRIFREPVHEWQDYIAVEQKPLAFRGMGDVGELVRRNVQLFGQDLPVARGLVEHIDIVGVLKDVLDLAAGQKVLHVLGYARRNASPLSEALPDLHGVRRGLFLLEEKVHVFVTIRTAQAVLNTHLKNIQVSTSCMLFLSVMS